MLLLLEAFGKHFKAFGKHFKAFGKHLKALGKHFHSIWKHFGKHFGSISEAFGLKSAFWKNALEKFRVCAVVKKYRFWLCSVVLATTGLLESFWKHLESFWKHIASKMRIMGSNNSKVCNNKAFGNMFRMYTLGVWSGHMLQDKEKLCSVLLGF